MEVQLLLGALVFVQVTPELLEAYTEPSPPYFGSTAATATSWVPSAEEATKDQELLGALVGVQVTPQSGEV